MAAQFLCAFVDKAWNLVLALCTLRGAGLIDERGELTASDEVQQRSYAIAFAVFLIPLMVASIPSAILADRFSKRSIMVNSMGMLTGLVALGTAILAVNPTGGWPLYVLLSCSGCRRPSSSRRATASCPSSSRTSGCRTRTASSRCGTSSGS
jgi:MFS family permease